ncbi:hypothetical protein AURDEDRAFT_153089 [Auricularia subglabra TFB-10046 SS5]|nr:hypothetical protein AURDEDRAFT_153089 [Auricularia subglabra TFB-10046 SS5]
MHVLLSARHAPMLPTQLLHLCYLFSTTSAAYAQAAPEAYPWPKGRRPSAHQIFHFGDGARPSQAEIKARYYELVRVHHPDTSALPAAQARARFQALADAYEHLRHPSRHRWDDLVRQRPLTPAEEAELARRREYHRAKRAADPSGGRDREPAPSPRPEIVWGEGLVISLGTLLFLAFAFPYGILRHNTALAADLQAGRHELARKALEDAEEKRRENGRARREEVRKMLDTMRAREDEDSRLGESDDGSPGTQK